MCRRGDVKMKRKAIKKNAPTKSSHKKIAIVVSLFNQKISDGLLNGAVQTLQENGYTGEGIKIFKVAGALEIPLIAKKIGLSKKYAGVVALGCVIRGETPHFEYVSLGVTLGCQQAQLDTGCPLAFGVLTVNNEEQAIARSSNNEFNKGREAVFALLDSLAILEQIT